MRIRSVITLFQKDLVWSFREWEFVFYILGPVLAALLIRFGTDLASRTDDEPPAVVIAAAPDSAFAEHLRGREDLRVASVVPELAAAREAMRQGGPHTAIGIPPGFEGELHAGRQPTLHVLHDDARPSQAARVDRALRAAVERFAHPTPPARISAEWTSGEPFSLRAIFLRITLVLAVLFTGLFVIPLGFGEEKEKGLLEALLLGPTTVGEVLAGKALFGVVVITGGALIIAGVGGGFAAHPGLVLLHVVGGAAAFTAVGLLTALLVRSRKNAELWATVLLLLFTQPVFLVDAWPALRSVAMALPSYWLAEGLRVSLTSQASPSDVAPGLAVLFSTAAVALVASRVALRRLEP